MFSSHGARLTALTLSILAVVCTLFALAAPAQTAPDQYVALGDSFSSGVGTNSYTLSSSCRRGVYAYPWLVAQQRANTSLTFVACSGASTADVMASQIQLVNAETDIVTITIGGNDIGFSSIAEDCFTLQRTGSPCRDQYVQNGRDEISERIAATAPKVAAVFQGIHERSPQARVFVLTYAAIFPEEGDFGCWPQMPVADGDIVYLREKQKELNAMLVQQAGLNGVGVIDWYQASIGHDACKPPGIRWVEPAVPANAAAPIHPNLGGMLGASELLTAALGG